MALSVNKPEFISPEDYLELEENSMEKHEYFNGEIFMMAGGSHNHNEICSNVSTAVRVGLRGTPCRQFSSETKLHVNSNNMFTYPDCMVVCGDVQTTDAPTVTITNPVIIFEVLSPSTENYDRGEKFRRYRPLPSFQEYVLIHQDKPYIEQHLRQDDISWTTYFVEGIEQNLMLRSVDLTIPLREIYEFVDWLMAD